MAHEVPSASPSCGKCSCTHPNPPSPPNHALYPPFGHLGPHSCPQSSTDNAPKTLATLGPKLRHQPPDSPTRQQQSQRGVSFKKTPNCTNHLDIAVNYPNYLPSSPPVLSSPPSLFLPVMRRNSHPRDTAFPMPEWCHVAGELYGTCGVLVLPLHPAPVNACSSSPSSQQSQIPLTSATCRNHSIKPISLQPLPLY
jgi:hypothetical protein